MKNHITIVLIIILTNVISIAISGVYSFSYGMKMRNCYIAFADDNPAVISDYKEIDKRTNEMAKRKKTNDPIAQFN